MKNESANRDDSESINDSSLIDTYSFPIFRTGAVLLSDYDIDPALTQSVASVIDKDINAYSEMIGNVLKGVEGYEDLGFSYDKATWRNKFGYASLGEDKKQIVDLPQFSAKFDGFTVDIRPSITLCADDRSSKIWTRMSCRLDGDQAASSLSKDRALQFFKIAYSVKKDLLDGFLRIYQGHLEQGGIKVELSPLKASFYAVNLEGARGRKPNTSTSYSPELESNVQVLSNEFASNVAGDYAGSIAPRNSYYRRAKTQFKRKISGHDVRLYDFNYRSIVHEYRFAKDELNFFLFSPIGIQDIKSELIAQNPHVEMKKAIFDDPKAMSYLHPATPSSESSRHLLLDFGNIH